MAPATTPSEDGGQERWVASRRGGIAAVASGLLVLASALTLGPFRDAEGLLTGAVALPLGLALALMVLGATSRTGWTQPGRWAALALAGQGAILTLVDAGNMVAYQHLRPVSGLTQGVGGLALIVLIGQAAVLVAKGRGALAALGRGLGRGWGGWRALVVVAAFVATSAAVSRSVGFYGTELVLATLFQGLALWTVAAAALSLGDQELDRLAGGVRRLLQGPAGPGTSKLPWVLAVWTVATAAALSWFAYQRHPHVPDEVVYILHARYFAAGLLELPLPSVLAAFDLDLMTVDPTRWFSPVPPGWPAMLAIGFWAGAPWLVNPVLGGIAVLLTYGVIVGVYQDRTVGRLTTLLMATSPWFLFMCMNFMTHTFTLVTALVGAFGTVRMVRGGSPLWALPAGAGIGLVALNRPLEGLVVAGLLGMWSLFAAGSPLRASLIRTAALAGSTLAVASVTFPYNRHFTGSSTHFPIMDFTDRTYGVGTNAMGFGANRGLGWPGLDPFPGHGLIDVLVNGNLNAYQVNIELLGWATGSLFLLALLVFGRRLLTADRMMIGAVFAVVGVHSFYWFSGGPDFGARYWYLVLVPSLALAARALVELSRPDRAGPRIWPAAAVLTLGAVCVFIPWRGVDKYHHYRGMRPDVRSLAAEVGFGADALVLIRGNRHPDYASAAIYNPLDLTGPGPLYAWDRDPQTRAAVLTEYADREVWILNGPTESGAGFQVVRGPVAASDLLAELRGSQR